MEWLKDKKNMPIVIAIVAVLLVVAGVVVFIRMSGGSSTPATTAAPGADPTATAGVDPNAPGPGAGAPGPDAATPAPGPDAAPAATPAAGEAPAAGTAGAAGKATASVTPMETWRSDPFLPVGYKTIKKPKDAPKPRIYDFPVPNLPRWSPDRELKNLVADLPQPVRRMSGILLNDRVYAIIETNGMSEIVQPGSTLNDRLATVERIEADKVVLKTTSKKPRYIVVRMASAPRTAVSTSTSSPNSPFPSPYGPGAPGGRRRTPMSPDAAMPPM